MGHPRCKRALGPDAGAPSSEGENVREDLWVRGWSVGRKERD